jgi:NTE family protein
VGVLGWIADHRPELLSRLEVITGSSVGAVNAVYLASRGVTPESVRELEMVWRELEFGRIFRFSARRVLAELLLRGQSLFGRRGEETAIGLFQAFPLEQLIRELVDWERLPEMMTSQRLKGLAIASTEIGSGRTHVFCQERPQAAPVIWPRDRSLVGITTRLGPEHVLASSSVPFLFPPVQVGELWYTDGSLRQNTPLSPALRLGANRLLVISLGTLDVEEPTPGVFPGFGQLLGKLFNSLFLDRMRWDLDRLERINDILEIGAGIYGPDFVTDMQQELVARGRRPYAPVGYVNVAPSADIGVMAGDLLASPQTLRSRVRGSLWRFARSSRMRTADLASYILFDGAFAEVLIALGRADAARHAAAFDEVLLAP